jgi:hypothetical protein
MTAQKFLKKRKITIEAFKALDGKKEISLTQLLEDYVKWKEEESRDVANWPADLQLAYLKTQSKYK